MTRDLQPGDVYDTGVATMGGRGQQATVPYPHAMHTVTMTTVSTDEHVDHYLTADEAITARTRRLREQGITYTRDGMTLAFTDPRGNQITLMYKEPS